jgi:hypothetical protein
MLPPQLCKAQFSCLTATFQCKSSTIIVLNKLRSLMRAIILGIAILCCPGLAEAQTCFQVWPWGPKSRRRAGMYAPVLLPSVSISRFNRNVAFNHFDHFHHRFHHHHHFRNAFFFGVGFAGPYYDSCWVWTAWGWQYVCGYPYWGY